MSSDWFFKGGEMYTKSDFINDCMELFAASEGNVVGIPEIGMTKLYETPLIGFASADDGIFETYRRPEVIGENYCGPEEWLPGAKTVISLFFPFTDEVRASNREIRLRPSTEWLYARIEGQAFLSSYMSEMMRITGERGHAACVPALDERFGVRIEMVTDEDGPDFHADSRWSERHAAYACGLGTFGLSRGLITSRGMAGRFASMITDAEFEPDTREYTGVYERCIRCGVCAENCPARAISLEHGKNNIRCNRYVESMKTLYKPRYGCGKCQVGVPCEHCDPSK